MRASFNSFAADSDTGQIVPGAQVYVTRSDGGALPQLWTAHTGGAPLGNPYNVDEDGKIEFFADPAVVDIEVSRPGGGVIAIYNRYVLVNPSLAVTGSDPLIVRPIASIAQMVGLTGLSDGQQFSVGGVGGGMFRYITGSATANNITVFGSSTAGGYLQRISFKTENFNQNDTRIRQQLLANRRDIYVLCQGDSTGDESIEFFRQMIDLLAQKYLTYTYVYITWDHGAGAWGTPSTLYAGTGSNTIYFYNGSRAGASPGYWMGNRNPLAYDDKAFDLIISNYGLNSPSDWRYQAEQLAEYLRTLRDQQPQAEILVTIQPTDYDLLDRTANRIDAQRYIASIFGCRTIDAYGLFLQLVAGSGSTGPWYLDSLHPTAAGGQQWAMLATQMFEYQQRELSYSPSSHVEAPIPNSFFTEWGAGTSSAPSGWVLSGATAVRDSSFNETYSQAARVVGSSSGVMYFNANELIDRVGRWGQIVIAARIRSSGTSGNCGLLYAQYNASTTPVEITNLQAPQADVDGEFRWAFLLIEKSFYEGNSDFRIGIKAGGVGEFVTIDRIFACPSFNIADADKRKTTIGEITDSAFDVPALESVLRTYTTLEDIDKHHFVEINSTSLPYAIFQSAQVFTFGQLTILYTNTSGSSINVPARTFGVIYGPRNT